MNGTHPASIERVPVFGQLDPSRRSALLAKGLPVRFNDRETLIVEGDRSDDLLLLVRGRVTIVKACSPDSTPLSVPAPALVGEIAAYAGCLRTATVRADGPVEALRFTRDDFLSAIRAQPEAGIALTDLVSDRLCAPDAIRQVGRYVIDSCAAKGGSGRVFRARDTATGERIALKMLSHARALWPDAAAAFLREAEWLAQMDHPGIVRVRAAFRAYDTCFIAMPWIEGDSLRTRMDRGVDFRPTELKTWTRDVLEALAALHQQGLIHADLKPSNILIDARGRAIIIDLGAGCFIGSAQTGGFQGSPAYASPELIMGRKPDGRSDLYSLCCTLYEVIYGRLPFHATSIDALLQAHLRHTPVFPRESMRVEMDTDYLEWLRKGMSRTRSARPDATRSLKDRGILG